MQDEKDESLRDTLVAAFQESTSSDTDTQGAEPKGATEAPSSSERSAATKSETSKPAAKDAPTTLKAPTDKAASAQTDKQPDKKPESIEPPARWTKEEKEQFAALDPNVQRILMTRNKGLEADYTRKMVEIAQERQRYNAIDGVLAQRREAFQRQGLDDTRALQMIFGYWDLAQRDPQAFINQFARERNIDLAAMYAPTADQLAQYFGQSAPGGSSPDGTEAPIHPAVLQYLNALSQQQQQLHSTVSQQQQWAMQQEQARLNAMRAEASSDIQKFVSATDENGRPLHEFVEDVRPDMIALMKNGLANTLQEAYDKAIYMRADVRSKIEENRDISRRRADEQRRQEEAARAKRAGSSVSASASGYSPQTSGSDDEENLSLREIIERQFQRASVGDRI